MEEKKPIKKLTNNSKNTENKTDAANYKESIAEKTNFNFEFRRKLFIFPNVIGSRFIIGNKIEHG